MNLFIWIKSKFDRQPIDEAAQATEQLDKKTESAGQSATTTSASVRQMGAVANMASGNIMGMAQGVAALSKSFGGLQSAVPHIAALAAAFVSVQKAMAAIEEWQGAYQKMIDGIKVDNATAAVESLKASYDRLKESMSAASQMAQDIIASEDGINEALRKSAIQKEDLALAEALRNTTDPLEQRRLELESAQRKSAIDDSYRAKSEELQREAALMEVEAAKAQIAAAEEMKVAAAAQFARNNEEFARVQERTFGSDANFKSRDIITRGGWRRSGREMRAMEENKDELGQYSANVKASADAFRQAAADAQAGQHRLQLAIEKEAQVYINQGTSATASRTATVTAETAAEKLDRDMAAAEQKKTTDAEVKKALADIAQMQREKDDIHEEGEALKLQTENKRRELKTAMDAADKEHDAKAKAYEAVKTNPRLEPGAKGDLAEATRKQADAQKAFTDFVQNSEQNMRALAAGQKALAEEIAGVKQSISRMQSIRAHDGG